MNQMKITYKQGDLLQCEEKYILHGCLWLTTNRDFSSWERLANVPQGIEPPDRWPR